MWGKLEEWLPSLPTEPQREGWGRGSGGQEGMLLYATPLPQEIRLQRSSRAGGGGGGGLLKLQHEEGGKSQAEAENLQSGKCLDLLRNVGVGVGLLRAGLWGLHLPCPSRFSQGRDHGPTSSPTLRSRVWRLCLAQSRAHPERFF